MVSDRVGDFIIRLQNAARIGKREVLAPYSAHLARIAKKLKELGFIAAIDTKENERGIKKILVVTLAHDKQERVRIHGVKRISKPGRRLYTSHSAMRRARGDTGTRLLSTSIGILSDAEARRNRVGGEELFEIW